MLTSDQVETFKQNGFLNAGPVFSEDELKDLSSELGHVLEKGPDGFGADEARPVLFRDLNHQGDADGDEPVGPAPVWQILNIWEACPAFRRLIYHAFIVQAISQLTEFQDLQVWHDQVQYKPAGTGGATPWHQDAPKWPSIEPMTPVSAWVPLDDADLANGCMWMVPGSYRWDDQDKYLNTQTHLKSLEEFPKIGQGFVPAKGAPIVEFKPIPCPVRRGEVHFHHSLTWHGSPTNTSNRSRRAVAVHYMTSQAKYTGRSHVMQQFIDLDPGEQMGKAGPHFPRVYRDGKPVGAPRDA